MINFLKETIDFIVENGKSENDVKWIGLGERSLTWDEFKEIANIKYDNGYGINEVHLDLIIVGDDWWLERHEYDGSEWWEFKTMPTKPDGELKIKSVKTIG